MRQYTALLLVHGPVFWSLNFLVESTNSYLTRQINRKKSSVGGANFYSCSNRRFCKHIYYMSTDRFVLHWSANFGLRSFLPSVLRIPFAGAVLLVLARPLLLQTGSLPVPATALPLAGKAFFLASTCSSLEALAAEDGGLLAFALSTLVSTPNGGAVATAVADALRRAKIDPVVSRFLGAV